MSESQIQAAPKPSKPKRARAKKAKKAANPAENEAKGPAGTVIDTRVPAAPKKKKSKAKSHKAKANSNANSDANSNASSNTSSNANSSDSSSDNSSETNVSTGESQTVRPKQKHHFKLRELLTVSESEPPQTVRFMTYNVLSQGLCLPKRYPTNGKALKWIPRFAAFTREIKTYKPDILFLQEVDFDYLEEWNELLMQCGLRGSYSRSLDRHFGILTAYNKYRWSCDKEAVVAYDERSVSQSPLQCKTSSIGYVAVLNPVGFETEKIIIANTHLYWHPNADYERCRQLIVLSQEIQSLSASTGATRVLFGGDLNSTTGSACLGYLNGELTPAATAALEASMASTDLGRVESQVANQNHKKIAKALTRAFSALKMRAHSLYNRYYYVDPENVGSFNEPSFTNWSDDFKNIIDYLLTVHDPQAPERLHVLKLLQLPRPSQMGHLPNSLSRMGYFPSDHLALMAEVAWIKND